MKKLLIICLLLSGGIAAAQPGITRPGNAGNRYSFNRLDIYRLGSFYRVLDSLESVTLYNNTYLKLTGGNQVTGYQNFSLSSPISALALIHVGNRNVLNSTNAQILVGGNYDNGVAVNGHAFADNSALTKTGTWAYAGYDGRVDITGAGVTADHYVSFQHGPNYNFTGTMGWNYGTFTTTAISAGTITNNAGYYAANPNKTGSGVMTNNYGVYIENQIAGSNNWSIYSAGGYNYFGGSMEVNGTQYLQNFGQQLRTKADGTANLDGGLYTNVAGLSIFGNWNQTRGFATKANGDGYYFGGSFGVGISSPTAALDVSGSGKFSGSIVNTNTTTGIAGTDSILVKDASTKQIRRIAANYYQPSITLTSGSIPFSNGTTLTQDNSNFFWDASNKRLGLLTAAPTNTLTLGSTSTGIKYFNTVDQVTNTQGVRQFFSGTGTSAVYNIIGEAAGTGVSPAITIGDASARGLTVGLPFGTPFARLAGGSTSANQGALFNFAGTTTSTSGSGSPYGVGIFWDVNQASGTNGSASVYISSYQPNKGSGAHYLINGGTNNSAGGLGTHTPLFTVLNTGQIFSNSLTASTALVADASKNIVSSSVTSTELGYVSGVTSAIQTQINAKQATITFGTGVQTALGVNIGSAGAPVLFNGAMGTPSSGVATNLTGTAAGLSIGGSATSLSAASTLPNNTLATTQSAGDNSTKVATTAYVDASNVGQMTNPMTTSGDIIYGGASGVPTRLAKSTDGQVLTLSGGVPTWLGVTGRSQLAITSSFTGFLNTDFVASSSTQYTVTLPSCNGFTADGGKIITILVTGTGGVKIGVPSGYSMQSGTSFATTGGAGGATLTQGQKVQIIPTGTNGYYLQPLNGTITLY